MSVAVKTVDGHLLRQLSHASLTWLQTNVEAVNALNVFPVPDGDTGTNMLLTMRAAVEEVDSLRDHGSVSVVAQALSHGALMGARGNSGVILSQLWRGLARGLDSLETANCREFARAFREATETAYRGVVKPVEGTILTVSRDIADAAEKLAKETDDIQVFLGKLVEAGDASVERTPSLLPVLKQAGVVDSGGQGLVVILEGWYRQLTGASLSEPTYTVIRPVGLDAVGKAVEALDPDQEWEVVVDFRPNGDLDLKTFYAQLERLGTSIQVGQGDQLYRMHIHLLKTRRYEPIEYCETLGTVVNVHMENLLDQMAQQNGGGGAALSPVEVRPEQVLLVAVSPGPGFDKVFDGPTVAVVTGGQTMNPSTKDLLAAFENEAAEQVIILPNNKNIQLAAEQAVEMSVKKVRVVPSRTLPQGVAAMMSYLPDGDVDAVADAMTAALADVETGELTIATRTVELDGVSVTEGDYIGLHNGKMRVSGQSLDDAMFALLDAMGVADLELLTLFYGADVTADAAQAMADQIQARFDDLEIELHLGGQPHYHYVISAE